MDVHGEVEAAFVVDISVAEVFLEVDALMILCASDGEKRMGLDRLGGVVSGGTGSRYFW